MNGIAIVVSLLVLSSVAFAEPWDQAGLEELAAERLQAAERMILEPELPPVGTFPPEDIVDSFEAADVWQVAGTGDFNYGIDTNDDIVWHNPENGKTAVWLIGTVPMIGAYLPTVVDPAWAIEGVADHNSDGHSDLLWRHQTTGQTAVWYMNGTTIAQSQLIGTVAVWRQGFEDLAGMATDDQIPNDITVNFAAVAGDVTCAGCVGTDDLATGAVTADKLATDVATQAELDAALARIAALESLLQHFTRSGSDVTITGANLHVVDGTGDTSGTPNGLGNVIIGYNELRGVNDDRNGSHMLVVGKENNYSSFGGIVVGRRNWTGDPSAPLDSGYASVSGGYGNIASGYLSSVSGGYHNTASGYGSSVSGGYYNTASAMHSSVSGGAYNPASGVYSSVSGGSQRAATGDYDWAAGSLFEDQ